MWQTLSKSILLLAFALFICCGIYPLALWAVGQTFFPFEANGSLLREANGNIIGSKLIAQSFTKDDYFHPRPSAAFYNPTASASSALSVSNPALRERVAREIKLITAHRSREKSVAIPADAVTTSASGLDPDITLENAFFQLDRVASHWAARLKRDPFTVRNEIKTLLEKKSRAPFEGLFGEKIVNVLEVNLALRKQYAAQE